MSKRDAPPARSEDQPSAKKPKPETSKSPRAWHEEKMNGAVSVWLLPELAQLVTGLATMFISDVIIRIEDEKSACDLYYTIKMDNYEAGEYILEHDDLFAVRERKLDQMLPDCALDGPVADSARCGGLFRMVLSGIESPGIRIQVDHFERILRESGYGDKRQSSIRRLHKLFHRAGLAGKAAGFKQPGDQIWQWRPADGLYWDCGELCYERAAEEARLEIPRHPRLEDCPNGRPCPVCSVRDCPQESILHYNSDSDDDCGCHSKPWEWDS
jgi:hypothetical protein